MKKTSFFFFFFFFFFTFFFAFFTPSLSPLSSQEEKPPQTQEVLSEGVGTIYDGNIPHARDVAINDALRQAVEQAIGTFVESDTLVKNYQLIEDNIYKHTQGYIKKYEILLEREVEGLYRVKIKAVVGLQSLKEDLEAIGLLYRKMKKPRIMVVVPERHLDSPVVNPVGETEIIKHFLKRDFRIVDQAQIKKIRETDEMKAAIEDEQAAALIGKRYGAEVIIIGEAVSQEAKGLNLGGLKSCRGRIDARAIKTDNGEIIAIDSSEASGVDISAVTAGKKALEAAGEKLAAKLAEQIIQRWSKELVDVRTIQLMVTNVDFEKLVELEKVLKRKIRGIEAIYRRKFSETVALYDIDIRGDIDQLATELGSKKFKDFKLEITGTTANRIDAKVKED
jgi:hypothetical protein